METSDGKTIPSDDECAAFLKELSDLCRKYKLGIEGGTLYIMEPPEDFLFNYALDEFGELERK